MSTLEALLLLLLILMFIVGGKNGLRSFISVVLNTLLILLVALLISWGVNILTLALIFIPLKLLTIIYLGTPDRFIAHQAFKVALGVSLLVSLVIVLLQFFAQSYGFGDQAGEELVGLSMTAGISYPQIANVVAIFSTLGAISEAAVAMSAGLLELRQHHEKVDFEILIKAGKQVGQDILGTAMNTILFGFFGSFLPLFIWYMRLNYAFGQIINDKLFVMNGLIFLYALIGVLLTMPLTVLLLAKKMTKE